MLPEQQATWPERATGDPPFADFVTRRKMKDQD